MSAYLGHNLAGYIYKIFSSQSIRYHIWRFAEKRMTQYDFDTSDECTELIGSLKGMKLRHPREDFASVVYKDFNFLELKNMCTVGA